MIFKLCQFFWSVKWHLAPDSFSVTSGGSVTQLRGCGSLHFLTCTFCWVNYSNAVIFLEVMRKNLMSMYYQLFQGAQHVHLCSSADNCCLTSENEMEDQIIVGRINGQIWANVSKTEHVTLWKSACVISIYDHSQYSNSFSDFFYLYCFKNMAHTEDFSDR